MEVWVPRVMEVPALATQPDRALSVFNSSVEKWELHLSHGASQYKTHLLNRKYQPDTPQQLRFQTIHFRGLIVWGFFNWFSHYLGLSYLVCLDSLQTQPEPQTSWPADLRKAATPHQPWSHRAEERLHLDSALWLELWYWIWFFSYCIALYQNTPFPVGAA